MKSFKPAVVRQPARRRRTLIVWAVVVVVLSAGGVSGWYFLLGPGKASNAAAATTTAQTYTATVRQGDLSISASGSGTLAAGQTADLSFSTNGLVTELNVQLGDTVKVGDVLARLASSPSLEAALAEAQLQVLQAQQALDSLQKNARLSLAQAYQSLLKAQTSFEAADKAKIRLSYSRCSDSVAKRLQQNLDRANQKMSDLANADKTSQQWIDAEAAFGTAQANLAACAYTEDEKTSINAAYETAQLTLEQAQQTYDTLKAAAGVDPSALALAEAKLKAATTQLEKAQEALSGLVITAPISGKVTYLAGGAGSLAGTAKFITVSNVSQPVININVDDSDIEKLVVGSTVEVVFDALPDQTFTGKVTQVDPSLTTSGQYKVAKALVTLDDSAVAVVQNLPLGLSASVTVISQQAKDAVLVPVVALKDLGDGQYAVMRVANGKMSLVMVEIGMSDGNTAQVLSGLQAGDVVSTGTTQASSTSSSSSSSNTDTQMMDPGAGGPPPDGGGGPMP
jgi:RND family efflux transporter MFP subunit